MHSRLIRTEPAAREHALTLCPSLASGAVGRYRARVGACPARLVSLGCLAVLGLGPRAAQGTDPGMVLAVLEPVDSEGILRPAARSALGDHISGVLGRIEGVSVIPSDQVRDLAAQKKTETYEGCYDQKCQIEIGMELAAQKLFILRISKLGQGCFA
ncbi:MAG: hypothetical protein HYV07_28960, partial [Deltaproteobacteria bacterium]|nr:hypothetical protein [Deltaproteobacteria bacterium]